MPNRIIVSLLCLKARQIAFCNRTPVRPGVIVISSKIIEAIVSGKAPQTMKLAAARGIVPLTTEEMLQALVALLSDESQEIRDIAATTVDGLDPNSFIELAADPQSSADVLGFLCLWPRANRQLVETVIFNHSTPDGALAQLAAASPDPQIIETISLKQQSLIRSPEIIEAILANPRRTPEAERRANEVRQEFFEKEFGAQMVAEEQRARTQAEAERVASADTGPRVLIEGIEDLMRLGLIEEGLDAEQDALIFSEYETEFGPFNLVPPTPDEQFNVDEIIKEMGSEEGYSLPERMPVFQRIALMSIKDRVMLAIKGTREARLILVRDPNRIVASAVLRNPRLTDTEVESIASIRTVPEEVLRQIGHSRAWTRSYVVVHNLVRNPRTPISISLGFINRIQTRDLRVLSKNKNIPDVIRTTAFRLFNKRGGM